MQAIWYLFIHLDFELLEWPNSEILGSNVWSDDNGKLRTKKRKNIVTSGNKLSDLCVVIRLCKLDVKMKMLMKIVCIILLASLSSISATDRQIVYEKCRGPGEIDIESDDRE